MGVAEPHQDGLGFVLLAGQNVGRQDQLVRRGESGHLFGLNSTNKDGLQNTVVYVADNDRRVTVITRNIQIEDPNAGGAAVLLHHVELDLELVDLVILVEEGRLKCLVLPLRISQELLELVKAVGLVIEPLVGAGKLVGDFVIRGYVVQSYAIHGYVVSGLFHLVY